MVSLIVLTLVKTITHDFVNYNDNDYSLLVNKDDSKGVSCISDNYFSSVRTRNVIEPQYIFDKKPQLNSVPKKLEMDFSRILNKPFFIKNVAWSNSLAPFNCLDNVLIPSDLLQNALAKVPFESSVLFRAKVTLMAQVAGTPMHMGVVIFSAQPNGSGPLKTYPADTVKTMVNNFMAGPHVFISANESTPVALEVPFYVNGKLDKCDTAFNTISPYGYGVDYANASLVVLNQLGSPTGGTTELTISIYAMFNDLEFYVPHVDVDFVTVGFEAEGLVEDLANTASKAIDGVFAVARKFSGDLLDVARQGIRSLTGLHNPNSPHVTNKIMMVERQVASLTDKPVQFEKLDPYGSYDRLTRDYIFDTAVDEMSLRYILSKPQYLGTFAVANDNEAGTLCWSRPITPIQQLDDVTYQDDDLDKTIKTIQFNNLIQSFARLSRFWKGSLKIHIQSVMTNFHFCKLALARDYSPVVASLTGYPSFTSIQNLLVDTMEFSAGGQVQTVELPFCSALNQLPVSWNYGTNSGQHGIYYIYLSQRLVSNGSVPKTVYFNVYVSAGDDFEYYGYATNPQVQSALITADPGKEAPPDPDGFAAESAAFEDTLVNEQKDLLISKEFGDIHDLVDMRPIVSIRDYIRRFYKGFKLRLDPATMKNLRNVYQIDIGDLIGMRPMHAKSTSSYVSVMKMISSFFLGYSGGARIKVVATGVPNMTAWFIPPGYISKQMTNGDRVFTGSVPLALGGDTDAPTLQRFQELYALVADSDNHIMNPYCQSVIQERVNYSKPSSQYYFTDFAETGTKYMGASTCVTEVEIPNLSPYTFMGDSMKNQKTALVKPEDNYSDTYATTSAAGNLGTLILSLGRPVNVSIDTEIELDIFISADDTARYGYQIWSPTFYLPGTPDKAGNTIQLSTDMIPSVGGTYTTPPATLTAASYYTKTT